MLLVIVLIALVGCAALVLFLNRSARPQSREVMLSIAYSPDKQELYEQLAKAFNQRNVKLPNGKRVQLVVKPLNPDEMYEAIKANTYQAISPDSSIWLGELERQWAREHGAESVLVGDSARYMISPVVIAMWPEVASRLGYPQKDLGWSDLLQAAAANPQFKWSHPSTSSASGLLATLAEFYAGAGVTRGLTKELATAQKTLDYVARLERIVKHYGESELAVMQQVEQKGRDFLDAFVVQEQLLVRHNLRSGQRLVAIYPVEGTMWVDHPIALMEHPQRTDDERLAYSQFKEFLLSRDVQMLILKQGYRPADLTIPLDHPDSPIKTANGVDPARPYTTLQIPSASVVAVVKNVWQYTKRRTNIYLIADVSGSMQGRKLDDAKAALQTFVNQIESDAERVGLIAFASTVNEVVPLTQLKDGRGKLQAGIAGLSAGGNTALLDAIDRGFIKLQDLRDKERINAIVVMTDGKENQSRIRLSALVDKLRRASGSDLPVLVFCIAYGSDADMQMLESISGAAGGFTRRGDPETIKNLYKTLSTYF